MTKNKPRHKFKQDGVRASNYCSHCGYYNCNPMMCYDSIAERKRSKRFAEGLCRGCGKKECKCKNKKGY